MRGEYALLWRHKALDELQLLDANYITHEFPRHYHDEFVLGLIERGADAFVCNGRSYVAPAGTILIMNAGDVHDGHAADGQAWRYRAMYPPATMLERIVTDIGERAARTPRFREPVLHDELLYAELRGIHELLQTDSVSLEAQSRLLIAIASLIARHAEEAPAVSSRGREPVAIRRALDYMNAHGADDLTLDAIARVAGLSPFWFIRVFERHVGLTPHAYLIGLRIKLAKRLLAGGAPLAEVALETGFADQSHFTRRFRSIVGVTPGRFARVAGAA